MLWLAIPVSSARTPHFERIVLGEWSATLLGGTLRMVSLPSLLTIEFHSVSNSPITEGTFWRDDINTTEFLPIETFLIGHVQVEWESETVGHVFTMQPERRLLTHVDFRQSGSGPVYSAQANLSQQWFFNISVFDPWYVEALVSAAGLRGALHYGVRRATTPKGSQVDYRSWLFIGIIIATFPISMVGVYRKCRVAPRNVVYDVKPPRVRVNQGSGKQRKRQKYD
jgi:hypothetical protein